MQKIELTDDQIARLQRGGTVGVIDPKSGLPLEICNGDSFGTFCPESEATFDENGCLAGQREPNNGWIKTSERLPDVNGPDVLLAVAGASGTHVGPPRVASTWDYWRPMPAPPAMPKPWSKTHALRQSLAFIDRLAGGPEATSLLAKLRETLDTQEGQPTSRIRELAREAIDLIDNGKVYQAQRRLIIALQDE